MKIKLYRRMTVIEHSKYLDGYYKFTYPRHWGTNESVITEIFGFNKHLGEKEIKKRIKKFVNCYMETNDIPIPKKNKFDYVDWNNLNDRVFHDMQTEIGNMVCLSFMTFCQCWSRTPDIEDKLPEAEDKYVLIEKEFNLDKNYLVLYDKDKKAYLRSKPVTYSQFTYGTLIIKTIQHFSTDRNLIELFDLVKDKYEGQQEIRFFLTFEPHYYINWSYSMGYMMQKYSNPDYIGDIDDLVDSLYVQAKFAKEWYEKFFKVENDSIYIKIDDFFSA